MNTKVEILTAAKEILSNPDRWIAGTLAEDGNGHDVNPFDSRASCFCSLGAMIKASTTTGYRNQDDVLVDVGEELYEYAGSIPGTAELAKAFCNREADRPVGRLFMVQNENEKPASIIWNEQDPMHSAKMHKELMEVFDNAIQLAQQGN